MEKRVKLIANKSKIGFSGLYQKYEKLKIVKKDVLVLDDFFKKFRNDVIEALNKFGCEKIKHLLQISKDVESYLNLYMHPEKLNKGLVTKEFIKSDDELSSILNQGLNDSKLIKDYVKREIDKEIGKQYLDYKTTEEDFSSGKWKSIYCIDILKEKQNKLKEFYDILNSIKGKRSKKIINLEKKISSDIEHYQKIIDEKNYLDSCIAEIKGYNKKIENVFKNNVLKQEIDLLVEIKNKIETKKSFCLYDETKDMILVYKGELEKLTISLKNKVILGLQLINNNLDILSNDIKNFGFFNKKKKLELAKQKAIDYTNQLNLIKGVTRVI